MKRRLIRLVLLAGLAGTLVVVAALASACPATGASAGGARLARMQGSPEWRDGHFVNELERVSAPMGRATREFLIGNDAPVEPAEEPPFLKRHGSEFAQLPASGLRVTWLGHSTLLVELDGARVLIDPVWGERASPFSWLGPKRFYPPPLPLDELPAVDAVVISHDHYDHLDYPTVMEMMARKTKWVVPLGVGAHLESWGMPSEQIVELDWWEDTKVGDLTVTCTPARHFSGRAVTFTDQNATLWAGWSLKGPQHSVFYSGDTALHPDFQRIGEQLGPFDLTMIESGAYNQAWADVHLGPEQAVLAHRLVKGKVMLPVHWGLFNLALHGWTEPIERVLLAAERMGVTVVAPRPGGSVELADAPLVDRWWPAVPWKTVEEEPAWSSSVEELQEAWRNPPVSAAVTNDAQLTTETAVVPASPDEPGAP